ncbi:MAG: valine--tRNA ligase [Armatimonadetes bacterium]|nr:valine--tRNA ligase [Armatimonadota bacterium]
MSMKTLPTTYDPRVVEVPRYQEWMRRGYFRAPVDRSRKPFVIMLPLPNVTGELHIGHASTFTIQDVLIRWRRMQGRNALWQPGTDHAGIATQNVVEREIAKEGLTLQQLGREKFEQRVWQWKEQYGDIIVEQLKRMGFSCDWNRFVFTLDPPYYDAVIEAFVRLYNQGLIYRGKRMVNWCPRDGSAISDLEVEYVEVDTQLWHVRYAGVDGGPGITIATQRPETILADVAVAVHPEDSRYAGLVGREVFVPIVNRRVPVIADRRVDPEFGTGALKITPGHDLLDNEIGADHNLPTLVVLDPQGRMTPDTGKYAGMDRFEARKVLGADLKAMGLVEKVEPYRTNIGTCDRCHAVIEPYISDQWFCDMTQMASRAAAAIRAGRVRFHHERWAKVVLHFLDHIRPWTISRQLWWGHRIPVWQCASCAEQVASKTRPDRCPKCGAHALEQDPDVLDTWFSSGIWPFATLGWPHDTPDLKYFYPGNVLVTASEILFLWIARMIMLGLHFRDDAPFTDVYVAPTVMTLDGRRMSKSLGTGIDPLEMADGLGYGADAVRFALVSHCSQAQQDLRFSEKMIADVRNFTTKIWNAARFVRMNLKGFDPHATPAPAALSPADRWIRSRYARVVESVTTNLEGYEFDKAARAIYDFLWSEYCDWYLELAKIDLQQASGSRRQAVQHTLWTVLAGTMQLLHPIMPFITEELWLQLPHDGDTIMLSAWPAADRRWLDPGAEVEMETVMAVIRAIRSMRAELSMQPSQTVPVVIRAEGAAAERLTRSKPYLLALARVSDLSFGTKSARRPAQSVGTVLPETEVFVQLSGLADADKERDRLMKALAEVEADLDRLARRLENPEFTTRAPAEVVEKERGRAGELRARQTRLQEILSSLESG